MPDLRVGVVGTGSLGQHHARVYAQLPGVRLVGVRDIREERAGEVAARHGCKVFPDLDSLIAEVDAASVAVPTVAHHAVTLALLRAGRSVLVEKPITASLVEADELIAAAAHAGAVLQVGHIERFNPATDLLRGRIGAPRFIEVHRLGAFSPRSLDIDVVLDLMIHDLDIVLSLDASQAVGVDAVGVPVLSPRVDIANARIRFASGLIANLTASRVSSEKVRKFRVFAPSIYVSLDFAARGGYVARLVAGEGGRPEIALERKSAPEEEPLRRQLEAFASAVSRGTAPVVSAGDGRRALELAHRVLAEIAAQMPPA